MVAENGSMSQHGLSNAAIEPAKCSMKITTLTPLLALLIFPACDQGNDFRAACKMTSLKVTVSGTVSFPEYLDGPIEIYLAENESEMCGTEEDTRMVMTPGKSLDKIVLDKPGTFSTTVDVNYIEGEMPPLLNVNVHHYLPAEANKCRAGGFVTIPTVDAEKIQINLTNENCVLRI